MRNLIRTAAMALVAAGLLGGAVTMSPTPAHAAGISVRIGDGHHWRRHHHRGWRHHRRHCRVVVTHRWRHGHRVTVRRRTCR